MTKSQLVAGLIYLPLHFVLLPLLIPLLSLKLPQPLEPGQQNLAYYAVGLVFTLVFFRRFLRADFDELVDNLLRCLLTVLMALGVDYLLSYAVSGLLLLLPELGVNPNNEAVMEVADSSYGTMKAISIFMAPMVEEVLFRGVVFGGVRRRSRAAAYAVSVLLFSLYHVWQYAVAFGDWMQLLYIVQYIPVSFALAWCYERSECIWAPIGFHMLINAMSFYMLSTMESMM